MRAALRGSYVDYVIFTGVTEKYPLWFKRQLDECAYTDESRFTFWVDIHERRPDYYEKQLIEDYSVILKRPNGEIHITDYNVFQDLYIVFGYDAFTNSGIAAYEEDAIEYVELLPGMMDKRYPFWFYEYFTEAVNLPNEFEGYLLFAEHDEVEVTQHCVVLRNRLGEIRSIPYSNFLTHYDDKPSLVLQDMLNHNHDNSERDLVIGGY